MEIKVISKMKQSLEEVQDLQGHKTYKFQGDVVILTN